MPRARSPARVEEMLVDELRRKHECGVGREDEDRPHEPASAAHDGAPEEQQQTDQNQRDGMMKPIAIPCCGSYPDGAASAQIAKPRWQASRIAAAMLTQFQRPATFAIVNRVRGRDGPLLRFALW